MKQEYKAIGSFGTLGIEIVLCIVFGWYVGHRLDAKFGTDPYITVVGALFGIAAAVKTIAGALKAMQAVTAREEREQGNPRQQFESPEAKPDLPREHEHDDDAGA